MTPRQCILASAALLAITLPLVGCSSPTLDTARPQSASPSVDYLPSPSAEPVDENQDSSSLSSESPSQDALSQAMSLDPAVAPALDMGTITSTAVSGEWALASITTDYDGLLVLLRGQDPDWEVVDAGVAGVGCNIVPPEHLDPLGLSC